MRRKNKLPDWIQDCRDRSTHLEWWTCGPCNCRFVLLMRQIGRRILLPITAGYLLIYLEICATPWEDQGRGGFTEQNTNNGSWKAPYFDVKMSRENEQQCHEHKWSRRSQSHQYCWWLPSEGKNLSTRTLQGKDQYLCHLFFGWNGVTRVGIGLYLE